MRIAYYLVTCVAILLHCDYFWRNLLFSSLLQIFHFTFPPSTHYLILHTYISWRGCLVFTRVDFGAILGPREEWMEKLWKLKLLLLLLFFCYAHMNMRMGGYWGWQIALFTHVIGMHLSVKLSTIHTLLKNKAAYWRAVLLIETRLLKNSLEK